MESPTPEGIDRRQFCKATAFAALMTMPGMKLLLSGCMGNEEKYTPLQYITDNPGEYAGEYVFTKGYLQSIEDGYGDYVYNLHVSQNPHSRYLRIVDISGRTEPMQDFKLAEFRGSISDGTPYYAVVSNEKQLRYV